MFVDVLFCTVTKIFSKKTIYIYIITIDQKANKPPSLKPTFRDTKKIRAPPTSLNRVKTGVRTAGDWRQCRQKALTRSTYSKTR